MRSSDQASTVMIRVNSLKRSYPSPLFGELQGFAKRYESVDPWAGANDEVPELQCIETEMRDSLIFADDCVRQAIQS